MFFKIDNLLIAGNGFDMDLGLDTSYKKFVLSDEWIKMCNSRKKKCPHPSLIDYIERKSKNDCWFDLEKALLDYVLDDIVKKNVKEDEKDYNATCKTLVKYLCNLFEKPNPALVAQKMTNSCAGNLLKELFSPFSFGCNVMYTFNYTPLEIIYVILGGWPSTAGYHNIHGEIKREDFLNKAFDGSSIILGIMTEKEISPDYFYLIKTNHPKYKHSNIKQNLLSAENVIIFGHSLNQIDSCYFIEFFKELSIRSDKERKLTIVTKDESSKNDIFVNIETMGISVSDFLNNPNIQFRYTKYWSVNNR